MEDLVAAVITERDQNLCSTMMIHGVTRDGGRSVGLNEQLQLVAQRGLWIVVRGEAEVRNAEILLQRAPLSSLRKE